jgi:gliding motility-associated-like protein
MLFQTGIFEPFQSGTILNTVTLKNEKYVPLKGLVQSEYGCVEEINLKARVLDRIKNSNVFSPNDDGKNDIWKVPYSDVFPDLEIKIFNRWGAEVWAASGTTASMGWNGKTLGGRTLPFGTYYYVIKFNVEGSTKWKPISGSVTIVK